MKIIAPIIILLTTFTSISQEREYNSRDKLKDFSPDQIATLQTKRATLALDLTKEQQVQIKSYFLDNIKTREAKKEAHTLKKENGDYKKQTSQERYTFINDALDFRIAQKTKLKKILSKEQLANWDNIQKSKDRHHMKRGKHRNGHLGKPKRK